MFVHSGCLVPKSVLVKIATQSLVHLFFRVIFFACVFSGCVHHHRLLFGNRCHQLYSHGNLTTGLQLPCLSQQLLHPCPGGTIDLMAGGHQKQISS
jgi:hypothetical protein